MNLGYPIVEVWYINSAKCLIQNGLSLKMQSNLNKMLFIYGFKFYESVTYVPQKTQPYMVLPVSHVDLSVVGSICMAKNYYNIYTDWNDDKTVCKLNRYGLPYRMIHNFE